MDVEISSSPVFGPLSLSFLFGLYDLTSDVLAWGVDLGLGYTVNDMVKVTVDTAYDSAGVIPLTITGTVTSPIPHVTLVAQYTTTDVALADNLGTVTFATTVSY